MMYLANLKKMTAVAAMSMVSVFNLSPLSADDKDTPTITLEQIMADPDWMGRTPTRWYWGGDNTHFYYSQKREGSDFTDLYMQNIGQTTASKVSLDTMHMHSDRGGIWSKDGQLVTYSYQGNIFFKDHAAQTLTQVTQSSASDRSPQFISGDRIAFKRGDSILTYSITSGKIRELASTKAADKPKGPADPKGFIAKEQHDLIDFVADNHAHAKAQKQENDTLKASNKSFAPTPYYFGKGNRIVNTSLSPSGDKMIVAVAPATKSYPEDIMPNYVTQNGMIKAEKVRRRVGTAPARHHRLFLVDLASHSKTELKYDVLPDFDKDVLASVKTENAKAKDEKYKSVKKARNIYHRSIAWQEDGDEVAIMLRSHDNKDRWIAAVDFEKGTLKPQHQLHDNAWVNRWSANEMVWNKGSKTLYFLSEETGYAQLYAQEIGHKAKQLTKGTYVVSDLSQSGDGTYIYYRANKKHPGIYEIYRLNTATGVNEAVTDLGGMNRYALSPDGEQLLVEHSTTTMPPELYSYSIADKSAVRLTHTVSDDFLKMGFKAPEIIAVPSSHTDEPIYTRLYRPWGKSNGEKNRAVMFTHGAGYLQNSHQGWSGYFREYMFNNMLAQQGYVVMDMDYRASAGYGRDWRTAIYRDMGTPEVQDLTDGVNWMVANANVNRNRIGTYGGSYGGFLTLMALFKAPDLFEAGAAQRLVSDWASYNHDYTSPILNTPQVDPIAYRRSSPIYFAEGLKKPLLINAPMVDDNVFFQDTVRLVQRLIELEKENFETAIYPVEPHGFKQASGWLNEYRRIYKLFEEEL